MKIALRMETDDGREVVAQRVVVEDMLRHAHDPSQLLLEEYLRVESEFRKVLVAWGGTYTTTGSTE